MMKQRKTAIPVANSLRIMGALGTAILLVLAFNQIETFGNAAIYAATWVTFLHVCVGEFVFVRYLHANSCIQNVLDFIAGIFIVAGVLSISSAALWCAFFGAAFALAITKYMLVERGTAQPSLRRYAREKIRCESPAVGLLVAMALVLDKLPTPSVFARALQVAILVATTGFAIWMIGVRHVYGRLVAESKPRNS